MSSRRKPGYRGDVNPSAPGVVASSSRAYASDSEKEVVAVRRDDRAATVGPERDAAPSHPIRSMQGPFEESIAESEAPDANQQFPSTKRNAKERHQRLLEGKGYNTTYNVRWRTQQPRAKYHPLSKVIAQVAFGVHLLQQQLAKSDEEVVRILQRHVDEIDIFIQRAGEDLDTAQTDIQERINYLELPLKHSDVFDSMLEDRQFRSQIVSGNEMIEGVIGRTAEILNDSLVDINKGKEFTRAMSSYLTNIEDEWPEEETDDSVAIFRTMQANTEGWLECYQGLQLKSNRLGASLVQLTNILNEMQTRAGVASRRSIQVQRAGHGGASRAGSRAVSRAGSQMSARPVSPASSTARYSVRGAGTPTSRYARGSSAGTKPLPAFPHARQQSLSQSVQRMRLQNMPDRWEPTTTRSVNKAASILGDTPRSQFTSSTNLPIELPSLEVNKPPEIRIERSPLLQPLVTFPENHHKQVQKKSSFGSLKSPLRIFDSKEKDNGKRPSSSRQEIVRSRSKLRKQSLPDLAEHNTSIPDSAYSSGSGEGENKSKNRPATSGAETAAKQQQNNTADEYSMSNNVPSRGKSFLGGSRRKKRKDENNKSDISLPLHGRSVRVNSQPQYMIPRRESAPAVVHNERQLKKKASFGRLKRWFSIKGAPKEEKDAKSEKSKAAKKERRKTGVGLGPGIQKGLL